MWLCEDVYKNLCPIGTVGDYIMQIGRTVDISNNILYLGTRVLVYCSKLAQVLCMAPTLYVYWL